MEEIDKLRKMQSSGEMMRRSEYKLEAIVAKLTHLEIIKEAMKGSVGIFHISTFVDPTGLYGYIVSNTNSTLSTNINQVYINEER